MTRLDTQKGIHDCLFSYLFLGLLHCGQKIYSVLFLSLAIYRDFLNYGFFLIYFYRRKRGKVSY